MAISTSLLNPQDQMRMYEQDYRLKEQEYRRKLAYDEAMRQAHRSQLVNSSNLPMENKIIDTCTTSAIGLCVTGTPVPIGQTHSGQQYAPEVVIPVNKKLLLCEE